MKNLCILFLIVVGFGIGPRVNASQPSPSINLSLEESQNAARFCYGAAVGISHRVIGALLAGGLPDGMTPFRFDCRVEEYQGGVRVLLYLDDTPLEDTAAWIRPPARPSDKTG